MKRLVLILILAMLAIAPLVAFEVNISLAIEPRIMIGQVDTGIYETEALSSHFSVPLEAYILFGEDRHRFGVHGGLRGYMEYGLFGKAPNEGVDIVEDFTAVAGLTYRYYFTPELALDTSFGVSPLAIASWVEDMGAFYSILADSMVYLRGGVVWDKGLFHLMAGIELGYSDQSFIAYDHGYSHGWKADGSGFLVPISIYAGAALSFF